MLTFCSVVTRALRAHAQVMGASALAHHPEAMMVATVEPGVKLGGGAFQVVDLPEEGAAALLAHALTQADIAVYLDPQICVYDSLEPILEAATEHGVALVPTAASLPEDGNRPDYADLLAAGEISPAMVAVSRGAHADEFLGWWSRQSQSDAEVADGRWLALAREQLPWVATVADAGCNVSFWNLHQRSLARAEGRITAAGSPLRTVHFDGFRPDRPYWLSSRATRVRVIDDPVLSELCGAYAVSLREHDWVPPRARIGDLDFLGNGQRVDHLVRSLWTDALAAGRDFGDPLSARPADEFVAWMREPAEEGGLMGVSRYLFAAYLTRPDLQRTFSDLDGANGAKFVDWGLHRGEEVLTGLVTALRPDDELHDDGQMGVNVIGYLGETLGLAEAARLYVRALDAAGVSVSTTAIRPDLPIERRQRSITRYGSHDYVDRRPSTEPSFNLACLNADHLAALVLREGPGILEGRPTIGQWGWETDVLPPSWSEAFGLVDEVWVYSNFMAENLGRLLPMPVVVVPPAVVAPEVTGATLDIAQDDRFTFVFMLDLFSTLQRKNPTGLIEAFSRAFRPDEGPRLILKTINARFRVQAADELTSLAADRPDIELIDQYLDVGQKAALLTRADCYVSLHRSEGFGLPLAEAMALGTPVIATGYSGNLDFTTPHNSYLVDWSPVRVGPDSEIYPAHGRWAEPSIDHAAELMRWVWEHPAEAKARGSRAQADIVRDYAPRVTGAIARARLERLRGDRPDMGKERRSASARRVEKAMTFDLRRGVGEASTGPAGLMRRVILRLMLPFTYHQREVDRGLLDAVEDLHLELEAERSRGRRAGRRLTRLEATVDGAPEEDAEPSNGAVDRQHG